MLLNEIPLAVLVGSLITLILLSGFFSGSETGLMMMNRYRLKTLADKGSVSARLALKLLKRPDRLIGLILLGNNFVNHLAATVMALIMLRLYPGAIGLALGVFVLTLLVMVLSEITPKTLAALYPERFGLPASYVYWLLSLPLAPVVSAIHQASSWLLRQVRVSAEDADRHSLSVEELRTVVGEVGAMIPKRHQRLLLSILELEKGTVEDIMVPRSEVVGLDLCAPWPVLVRQMVESPHTRLPIYSGSIDDLRGVLNLRKALGLLNRDHLEPDVLLTLASEPYYIPEGTPLNQQLLNFQNQNRRIGFVVDEYGDLQGLVTIEDLLEEIVGEFTTDPQTRLRDIQADPDGAYRIEGSVTVRSLNRSLGWKLPTDGPRTINGLLLEKLEQIPEPGSQVEILGYRFEITETRANTVKAARVLPPGRLHRVAA